MRLHTRVLGAFGLLMILLSTTADDEFSTWILDKLQRYRQQYPPSKVYLHTDKPYYAAGDTLWFKAYSVYGATHLPDTLNKLLYVDLVDSRNGQQKILKRVQLEAGLGQGEISLGQDLEEGPYLLRAYTHWMENFDSGYFFQQQIYLFRDGSSVPEKVESEAFDLQFFPEGGQLIAGVSSRLSFKAVGADGHSVDVSGFVLSEKGDTLQSFFSEHLGMGRLAFTPLANTGYKVIAKSPSGSYRQFSFPAIASEGFNMVTDNITYSDKIRVYIHGKFASPTASDSPSREVYLVGHAQGVPACTARGVVSDKGLIMSLPTAELPDGILHLTLFDASRRPVCERLAFINHNRQLSVVVSAGQSISGPRGPMSIKVKVSDAEGRPVRAQLSASVVDAGQVSEQPYADHLLSNLLLTSDLKGIVEQPASYFDSTLTNRRIYVDYLMATQGWRRFVWNEVLQDSLPQPDYGMEEGITLKGIVRRGNKPIKEPVVLSVVFNQDSLSGFLTTETDPEGRFAVQGLVFSDSLQVRLQGMNKKGNQSLEFQLEENIFPKVSLVRVPYYPITVESRKLKEFLAQAQAYQDIERKIRANRERLLDAVTIKGKKEVERDSRKLYGHADATVKVTQQMAGSARSILDLLAGRVAGVQVVGSGFNAQVYIRGNRNEPQFILDGMPVDKEMIANINVFDVESIDVLKGASAAIYGSRGGGGVISILTKRANVNYDYSQEAIPGVLVTKIAGYDVPREFYAPRYASDAPPSPRPDYRSTLHWVPMLSTDAAGEVTLHYYHTDAHTSIHINVQGLSPDGRAGVGSLEYRME
ncbi:TonB-dependent receptor plug domain-containing protein [Dyadobacter tibetensis]|uniref:TonB-dependent receptor plug domain-containing protein n=1 Tax=Dyadobacter tibetensis TaxID=1211851 RepID=UPI00046FAF74|nr:TonB-dependent receptor plug domain-containing protein [Dyadobacter tibetensis]